MTRIAWGAHGERLFETGTDRGVLYLNGQSGIPWNGLRAVKEAPSGGEPRPYYIDGFKYLNIAAAEEFVATLEAFSAPNEFAECDGRKSIHNGLFAGEQPRKSFGLSYRTLIGNDYLGDRFGYKIHIVYNALAAPSQRANETIGASVTTLGLSWSISTMPPRMDGLKPTAHFVIDSTLTPPKLMAEIEDILYGSIDGEARLPDVDELLELFKSAGPVVRENTILIPRPAAYSGSDWVGSGGLGGSPEAGWIGGTLAATTAPYIFTGRSYLEYQPGDKITLGIRYRVTAVSGPVEFICVVPGIRTPLKYYRDGYQVTRPITLDQDEIVSIEWIAPEYIAPGTLQIAVHGSIESGLSFANGDAGFAMRATEAIIEPGWSNRPYFDGDTIDTDIETYEWANTPGSSPSLMRSWY
ncbi:major tail protein [Microbacterium phage Camille]|nr:major tail protein [Microbacterium phage Camille]